MEAASCSTIATLSVRNETVPIKICAPVQQNSQPITSSEERFRPDGRYWMHSTRKYHNVGNRKNEVHLASRFSVEDLSCTVIPTNIPYPL